MKAYKVTISGSYHMADKNIVDFEGVEGIVPANEEDVVEMHVKRRYATMWLQANKDKYPERIHNMREVHIDEMEEIKDHKFSFEGKDVKLMTFEELQDLATAKDLRRIPTFKNGSVREARVKAYAAYSNDIKGEYMDPNEPDFDFASLKPLIIDSKTRVQRARRISNDDVINAEMKTTSTKRKNIKSDLTMAELKELADDRKITYPPKIKYDDLYNKLFS